MQRRAYAHSFRATRLAASLALGLSYLLLPGGGAAAEPDGARVLPDFFARMERHFADHPTLARQRGSGWNPYNRAKWFEAPLLEHGALPGAGQRQAIFDEKRRRAALRGGSPAWFELGPVNLSGRILDIEFHPTNASIVYAGSASGGLWKSTDSGDTWVPLTDELPSLAVGGIAVSGADPNVVLIGTGEGNQNAFRVPGVGVLKSTDGGGTWAPTNLAFDVTQAVGFHFLEVNRGTGVYLAGTTAGMYRSTDEGSTWAQVLTGYYWDAVWEAIGTGSTRVYAVGGGDTFGGNTVRVSTNDGLTWTLASTGLPSAGQIGKTKLAFARSEPHPTTLYAHVTAAQGFHTMGIYRSTDNGASWHIRSTENIAGGQGWYSATIAVPRNNWNVVLAGGIELWKSTDGGATFVETGDGYGLGTDTALHWDHHVLKYRPGSGELPWCGTDGGVWASTDGGDTWASRRAGINTYQFYDVCVAQSDPDWLMGGSQDNGVNGPVAAQDWFTSNLFADGMVCNIDPSMPNTVYAEWQFGNQVKSTDSGATWFDIQSGLAPNGGIWVTPVAMDRTDPAVLHTRNSGGIYSTTDGGASWSFRTDFPAIWIDVDEDDGEIWAVSSTGVRRSTDAGASWADASAYGFAVGVESRIAADPALPGGALVTFGSYNAADALVARTTDFGATWTDVTGDLPAQPVNVVLVDPAIPADWYIGTDTGVWRSTNGGANWLPYDDGLPNVVVQDLEIRDSSRKLVAGTYGRGAWEVELDGAGVGVPVVAAAGSRNLMLDPPFPNPVSDGARLRFAARHDGPVRLSIVDVRGRRIATVATLAHGDGLIREALWHTDGARAGVYFAVVEAGSERRARKILVTR